MNLLLELYDPWGRRIAWFDEVPLLDAITSIGDGPNTLSGLLPLSVCPVPHGSRIRLSIEGKPVAEGYVSQKLSEASDLRKLVAERYVRYHEIIAFEASRDGLAWNTPVREGFTGRSIDVIVRKLIQAAPGRVHYAINHTAFPDGALREFAKFETRRPTVSALPVGGIGSGQWVGADRIDTSGVSVSDGDTLSGLIVDGIHWPSLRLMMVDAEEQSLGMQAWIRHPETITWTPARYSRSGYALDAERTRATLQDLINTYGIDYIELNPHRGSNGLYDNRVDEYGRYVGLIYGGGMCLNAAMIELGVADVYLYQDGTALDPTMELKDYLSYTGPASASVEPSPRVLRGYEADGGLLENLTSLAAAAGGWVWSVNLDGRVSFREPCMPDTILFDDPARMGVALGTGKTGLTNALVFSAAPDSPLQGIRYSDPGSVLTYGAIERLFYGLAVSHREDIDLLMQGLLRDTAWPALTGAITFWHGESTIRPGDLVELRSERLHTVEPDDPLAWGGRFTGRRVARVNSVRYRIAGRRVETIASLTAPLRSVSDPVSFMVRSQSPASQYFQARLDEDGTALDDIAHLD